MALSPYCFHGWCWGWVRLCWGHDQPIHDAARTGTGKDVEKILRAEPAVREARTLHGSTPLHLAATNPDSSALKALLAAGG